MTTTPKSQGAAIDQTMRECPDCEGAQRVSPVELCARCDASGIIPDRAAIDQAGAPAGYVERSQLEWLIRRTGDTASIQLWRGHAPVDAVPVYLTAPAGDTQQAPDLAQQLQRMRAAFHTNMLRAFPDKTHAEISAEIDKAVGDTQQASEDARDAKPSDCSGDPGSCPDNEGRGCYCTDNGILPHASAPLCPHCGTRDIQLSRTCHNSACTAYATPETTYEGWKAAAPTQAAEREPTLTTEQIAAGGQQCTYKNRVCFRMCGKHCKSQMEAEFVAVHKFATDANKKP